MTIAILPAQLANQIAAGEVVERPASVIKELVENSVDAGATNINIEVDKGGVKRIRITDNGIGITKDELTLALSRHATSKIKDLSDLEAINSLGFRGEALASISSVARLTLTSKPKEQETAWQASAEGREMAVTVQPAAHPDGTTIEVLDLFFNTPARRKFLRTEKTEFNHIDEVIRRIALACFDVSFSLTHNGKVVRQYRAAVTKAQSAKRVAMVCGQKFIDNAIEVNCQHDEMLFTGWLAKPSFARNQNDLCYSYVNGRMMRDKLINHAIRQAYADLLPPDTYPAFVLFLTLDHREVDVNVHPAKHEVRFHQSRYVHDFIYSVCHEALITNNQVCDVATQSSASQSELAPANVEYVRPDYVKPLSSSHTQQIKESPYKSNTVTTNSTNNGYVNASTFTTPKITKSAVENYQQLMTPVTMKASEHCDKGNNTESLVNTDTDLNSDDFHPQAGFFIAIEQEKYGVFKREKSLRLVSLTTLAFQVHKNKIEQYWQKSDTKPNKGLISQPLLLPVVISLSEPQLMCVKHYQSALELAGIFIHFPIKNNKNRLQIRQFPALLRDQDVSVSFIGIIDALALRKPDDVHVSAHENKADSGENEDIISAVAHVMVMQRYNEEQADALWREIKKIFPAQKIAAMLLKSVPLDLTSQVKQLISITE